MTIDILPDEVDKDSYNYNLEKILAPSANENGMCRTCPDDHSLKVSLDEITITINQIYRLLRTDLEASIWHQQIEHKMQ